MATKEEKITELKKKKEQLDAQIQALVAAQSAEERKKDNRKKILVGAAILARVKRGIWQEDKLMAMLSEEIKNNRDRAFLGLPPLENEKPKEEPKPNATGGGNRQN